MKKILITVGFALSSLFIFLIAQAQTDSFSYPIAELGNCNSKTECKNYCSQEENFEACAVFAEQHNLLPKGAKEKKALLKEVLKNKGPGGCNSKETCEAYCSAEEHLEECLEFGKKHGLISKEEEEKAGRFLPLMKQGLTPGGCKSKDACEAYCRQEEHQQECIDFAVKIGALTKEQAEKAKVFNGQGPGGCKGREECQAFCNKEENQETCLDFAKEHGLIKDEELQRMKEGIGQVRVGLENAPEEVKECLKETVDKSILSEMESGKFTPTSQIGQTIRECFEKFRPQLQEQRQRQFKASPEMEACLKTAVGEDVFSKIKTGQAPPSPELGQKMRACFEQFGPERFPSQEAVGEGQGRSEMMQEATRMMQECMGRKVGSEAAEKLAEKKLEMTEEVKAAMEACKEEFQKMRQVGSPSQGEFRSGESSPPPPNSFQPSDSAPNPAIFEQCKKEVLSGVTELTPEIQNKITECLRAKMQTEEVKGAQTSRLPGFIRWLLGR